MAITGIHTLLYTTEPQRVRQILAEVFGWKHVDAGDGWLIFRLPPTEMGIHPAGADGSGRHEVCFLCDNLEGTIAELRDKGLEIVGEPKDQGFGITTTLRLPGGVDVLLYEPRHALAIEG